MRELRGRTVLITGAGSGLGRMMALELAAEGVGKLVLWDIRLDLLKETKKLILGDIRVLGANRSKLHSNSRRAGDNEDEVVPVELRQCDLSKKDEIYRVADETLAANPQGIDILINNAGIVSGKPFLEIDDVLVERTMAVNAMAPMWMCKKFLPPMLERNCGHIVTIASAAGISGVAGLADYSASKFAAVGFDEAIRLELKKMGARASGVKTTVVCPFYINTGMFDGVKTKVPWLLPLLEPQYVVDNILRALKNDIPVLYLPKFALFAAILAKAATPTAMGDWLNKIMGISSSMDEFRGRGSSWAMGGNNSGVRSRL